MAGAKKYIQIWGWEIISSTSKFVIPISLVCQNVLLNTDIIVSDKTLLLSRKSMKKDNMTLDFKNDHAVIFDHSVNLIVTKSGHYGIYKCISNNFEKCNFGEKHECNLNRK